MLWKQIGNSQKEDNMAPYTLLNEASLLTILAHYDIKKVTSYAILSGGSENTNYLVRTEHKAFVLTICEQKSMQETKQLASLLAHLKQNNFTTSIPIKTIRGTFTTVWNGKPTMLKAFIEGDIIKDLSNDILKYLGRELAKLHKIKAPNYLRKKLAYGIERFDDVQVYAADSLFYKWLKHTQNFIENYIHKDLPKALIHSDIFYNNIIIAKDAKRATIMDFEEACYYYRVFDIGMMITGTCSANETVDLGKIRYLLQGYQEENKLSAREKEALQAFTVYGAAATAFWRHQNFNYTNIDETRADRYLEMKILADNIRNIPAKEFIACF